MRALLLPLLLLAVPASAQAPDSLTVFEALSLVERAHPLVRASEALATSREAAVGGVTAWAAPTLGYAVEGVGASGGFEQRIVAGVEVGPASLARAERQRLAAEARAYGFDADATRRALRARVVAAYVDLGVAESRVGLRLEAVALADSLVRVARLREEAGEGAGLETLRAELEAERARATLAAAVGQREAARAAAVASLGLPVDGAAAAPTLTLPDVLPPTGATAPLVAAAGARVEAAQASADAARASRRPVWSAEVFPQHFGGDTFGAGFQVGVRLPLGQGRIVASRVRAAEAARQSAEAERDGLAAERRASVAAAEARVRSARVTLEAARGAPVERAEALLALALRGYQLGEVTQPMLLGARQALLDAREVGLDAFRDALLAVVAWERVSGERVLFTD
ncbi:TolC family protein [Rubricoccus marinus]|uniref:Transporter n=1 Tax=Rubricoccus marinus TaxID=716817 RepID=A0A259TUI0_9BACT|nr:TolC family protein [Rubricoccus marinus]OZC01425.1 hypothetical protein BSZ36_17240 [Rubricoccus marinus]